MSTSLCLGSVSKVMQSYRCLLLRNNLSKTRPVLVQSCSSSSKQALTKTEEAGLGHRRETPEIQSKDIAKGVVVSDLQRKILVHFKYFKDVESVPERVSFSTLNKAISKARIKVSMLMMAATMVCCLCVIIYSRNHRYEMSLVEVNMRRHEAYKRGEDFMGRRLAVVTMKREDNETKKEE